MTEKAQPNLKDLDLCVTVAAGAHAADLEILEPYVAETLEALRGSVRYFELLIIDNSSSPAMADRLEKLREQHPNLRVVTLSRTYGEEIVFTAALDHCIGDFVVLMDPRTDPPTRIPEFIEKCHNGLDAVIGTYDRKKEQSLGNRCAAFAFYRVVRWMTGAEIEPNAGDFRVLSRRIVNAITRIKDKERYIKYLMAYVGYEHGYIRYERLSRGGGRQPRGFFRSLEFAINMVVTYSNKPLRWLSIAGVASSFVSLCYIVFVLAIALFEDSVSWISAGQGWASTNAFNAAMFFLLFSMLAVLSEYVMKVLHETQQRPLYHVADETTSRILEEHRERVNVI